MKQHTKLPQIANKKETGITTPTVDVKNENFAFQTQSNQAFQSGDRAHIEADGSKQAMKTFIADQESSLNNKKRLPSLERQTYSSKNFLTPKAMM